MGKLYDIRCAIDRAIQESKLDGADVRGQISMKTGFLFSMISQSTLDDPAKISKLRTVATEVLKRPF